MLSCSIMSDSLHGLSPTRLLCPWDSPGKNTGVDSHSFLKGMLIIPVFLGFPGGSAGKESACNAGNLGSIPGLGRFPWGRERLPTPVFWPGEFHGL